MSNKSLRIVFMGSPEIAVGVLKSVVDAGHDIVCVYTQPPRKAGRGKKLRQTPVHDYAATSGLDVRTPLTLKRADAQADFKALNVDLAVVVAYGLILPQPILDAPRLGCLNMHASILPRWRGAAPIQRAIMAGDTETGVDAMMMEAGLDTGPVLMSARTPILPSDNATTVHDRLADLAADLAPRAITGLANGTLTPGQQSADGATYAHKITARDCGIDWSQPALSIRHQVQGLAPQPGAYCWWQQKPDGKPDRLKVLEAEAIENDVEALPGTVLNDALTIKCGCGALRLAKVQKPGGKPVSAQEFLHGSNISVGDRLSSVALVRKAEPADIDAILALNDAAFGGDNESGLVAQLSANEDSLLSLVAELEGRIVGHLQAFPVEVDGNAVAAGIGPMSVLPEHQRAGVGGEMIKEALRLLRRKKVSMVFVLGHADYYPKFGFSESVVNNFEAPWKGPHFMGLRLMENAPETGKLSYPEAFGV